MADIGEAWSDETYTRFIETYLEPIEPRMQTMIDAIHRLAEVLNTAERQCRDEHEWAESRMMTEPFSPDGPQQILTDLCHLAAERVPAEEAIAGRLQDPQRGGRKSVSRRHGGAYHPLSSRQGGRRGRVMLGAAGGDGTLQERARGRKAEYEKARRGDRRELREREGDRRAGNAKLPVGGDARLPRRPKAGRACS